MPIAGSVISVFGRPYSLTPSNGSSILVVTVEDIVYNPGSMLILADAKPDSSVSPRRLQVRKRLKTSNGSGSVSILCFVLFFVFIIFL